MAHGRKPTGGLLQQLGSRHLYIPDQSLKQRQHMESRRSNTTHQVRDLENLIDALVIIEKSRILVNTTVEQITDHFVFRQMREGETALFAEESLRGRWGMVPNLQQEDSKLDMELFFNAVLEHPAEIEKVLK